MTAKKGGQGQSRGKRNRAAPFLVLAGVVGPMFFVLVFTIDGWWSPGYSPLSQSVSSLGTTGTSAWIQNANFVVFGLLLMTFAIGFWQLMREVLGKESVWVTTLLLILTGAGLVNDGFFTQDTVTTLHGLLHALGFLIIFASLIVALLLIGRQLRTITAWRGLGWYSTITGLLTLGVLVLQAVLADPLQMTGLFQRILVLVAFSWYVVMGCQLFAFARAPARSQEK
jgi:hypothetical membrane protein